MTPQSRTLETYLTVSASLGCIASSASAAVTVYGENSANDTNANPVGIDLGVFYGSYRVLDSAVSNYSVFAQMGAPSVIFTRGEDQSINIGSGTVDGEYGDTSGGFANGAVIGDQNYALISFDGNDDVYEAVAQFSLDANGNGYLIAIATTNPVPNPQDLGSVGGPALAISRGKAMIDAAIPEPSSLALLALGSAGLVTRRQRRKTL